MFSIALILMNSGKLALLAYANLNDMHCVVIIILYSLGYCWQERVGGEFVCEPFGRFSSTAPVWPSGARKMWNQMRTSTEIAARCHIAYFTSFRLLIRIRFESIPRTHAHPPDRRSPARRYTFSSRCAASIRHLWSRIAAPVIRWSPTTTPSKSSFSRGHWSANGCSRHVSPPSSYGKKTLGDK